MARLQITIGVWDSGGSAVKSIQGESNSRILEITFLDKSGQPIDLTGSTPRMYVNDQFVDGTILDATGGKAEFPVTSGMLSKPGSWPIEYLLSGPDYPPLKANGLMLKVDASHVENAVESDDKYSSLVIALNRADAAADKAEQAKTDSETAVANANTAIGNIDAKNQEITAAEAARVTAENGRVTAESARVSQENARKTAETTRQSQEGTRQSQESTRQTNETARGAAETTRSQNEDTRNGNEAARKTAEQDRAAAEADRQTHEADRRNAEDARVGAENARVTAENARKTAETSRASAESTRQTQETARQTNETARADAESARVAAENKRQTDTQTAISGANTARDSANTAADRANTAAQNAEDAIAGQLDPAIDARIGAQKDQPGGIAGYDKTVSGITLSGNPVTASGVLCDCISSCVVHGLTTETGTGDKSPDNPYTLAGAQYVQIANGKNLFHPQPGTVTANGVTCTVAEDGTITLDGTATASTTIECSPVLKLNAVTNNISIAVLSTGLKYTMSRTDVSGTHSSAVQYGLTDTGGTAYPANRLLTSTDQSTTFTAGQPIVPGGSVSSSVGLCFIFFTSDMSFTGYKFRLQFEQSDVATPWEPFKGLQLIQLPQPLYSLLDGTVDEYDAVSGSGTANILAKTYNGTEAWYKAAIDTTNLAGFGITERQSGNKNILCDRLNVATVAIESNREQIYVNTASQVFARVLKSRLTNWSDSWTDDQKVAAFKTWLSANPVTVLYALATPQAISGTPTQLLNAPGKFTVSQADGAALDVTVSGAASGADLDAHKNDLVAHVTQAQKAAWTAKAEKSSISTATLPASGWTGSAAPYSYALSVAAVTATSANELLPGASITADQLDALQSANIQDGGQAAGHITLLAYGDKPGIDLPVRVIVRGDL